MAVWRHPGGEAAEDAVAVEEPLELRVDGSPLTVIMRTPGDDEELALGFLHGEALIGSLDEVRGLAHAEGVPPDRRGNVLDVLLGRPVDARRRFYASAACGVCGKTTIDSLAVDFPPVESTLRVAAATVAALPSRMRAAQRLFEATGGLHAAALFDEQGALLALREDVGRHNAVDKVLGWALRAGRVPASRSVLQVSGRGSFEIVQKAVSAGVPVLSCVSAPSTLAVDLARRFRVTLCGFVRDGGMKVYAQPGRIA
ncbi:MAG: formate dehydrogenase accessory sulfurtransferase FdhD [Planctomycetes bacterium]|nr:formate dehydrogenase accessory sulfurtransferase FdhD [Planctomycetota bacterium]